MTLLSKGLWHLGSKDHSRWREKFWNSGASCLYQDSWVIWYL